ncbi:hypothetical protein MASR2M74_27280 [Paracoccaceae bacterium]
MDLPFATIGRIARRRRHNFPNPGQNRAANPGDSDCKVETSHRHEQEPAMKKERRWMKSVLAASTEVQVAMPWARGARRRPQAMKPAVAQPVARALAAR